MDPKKHNIGVKAFNQFIELMKRSDYLFDRCIEVL